MAAESQEARLQPIDWLSQIRAVLHEPINGSDSSGPAGNLRSNFIARSRSNPPPTLHHSLCLLSFFLLGVPVSVRYQRPWDNGYESAVLPCDV